MMHMTRALPPCHACAYNYTSKANIATNIAFGVETGSGKGGVVVDARLAKVGAANPFLPGIQYTPENIAYYAFYLATMANFDTPTPIKKNKLSFYSRISKIRSAHGWINANNTNGTPVVSPS